MSAVTAPEFVATRLLVAPFRQASIRMCHDNETQDVRDFMAQYFACKWGFVVYRCTYGDEQAWREFMKIMNAFAL